MLSPSEISNSKTGSALTVSIKNDFKDIDKNTWNELLTQGDTNTVNLTWEWQNLWWKSFGYGRLLLVVVERNGNPIVIAPFFTDEKMVYNLFPEDSLDFVGKPDDEEVLVLILGAAQNAVTNFLGFRFYFIPAFSRTGGLLEKAATCMCFNCYKEETYPSPMLDIASDVDRAKAMTQKKSLRRHENYFIREGKLEVAHLKNSEAIIPHLEDFFNQHTSRRNATNAPSIFMNMNQRNYYKRLTLELSKTGWLRFTIIKWNDRKIAFHYGLSYNGRYLYGIPAFDITLSNHSPGEVLLKHVLLDAISEGATKFDFGIGDEAYKYRFSTDVVDLNTWGLYPIELEKTI